MDEAWEKLNDGRNYKIYKARDGWWDPFPYTAARPDGSVLTCSPTRWGARWAIRRAIRRGDRHEIKWWDKPLVEEVAPDGER